MNTCKLCMGSCIRHCAVDYTHTLSFFASKFGWSCSLVVLDSAFCLLVWVLDGGSELGGLSW